MKRLFTSLMVLTAMLCSITTQAAEYDLSVGGVTVTDANKSDIKPSGLTAGKISFSSNTLTFDNVTMKVTGQYLIYNKGIEGLKVVIKGTNKLESNVMAFWLKAATTIMGYDTSDITIHHLTITTGANYPGVKAENCDLTLKDFTLVGTAGRLIEGNKDYTLTLDNTIGWFTGESESLGAINGFKNVVMTNKTTMTGTYYSTSKRALLDGEGKVSKAAFYMPYTKEYEIYILGEKINNVNMLNFVAEGVNGVFYNESTNTLTLKDAEITAPDDNTKAGIRTMQEIIIKLEGDNTITTNDGSAINNHAPLTIEGDGKLSATSETGSGLSVTGNYITTINVNNKVHFEGKYGYWGNHTDTKTKCNLILKKAGTDSDYYFKGSSQSIKDVSNISCTDMDFYYSVNYGTPGCYFDEDKHAVCQNGGTIVKGSDVNFYQVYETFDLYVGDTQVNSSNCQAIGSKFITSGPTSVSYSNSEKVLTMENASMEYSGAKSSAIYNSINGLTINVVGDNTINANKVTQNCIYTNYAVTLAGSGSFTSNTGFYIVSPTADPTAASLTIDGPTVTVSHISGWNNTDSFAILDGKLSTTYSGMPVMNIENFTLGEGMKITTPAGATFNATLGGITTDGTTLYEGPMVIEKVVSYALSVNDITVTSANAADILGDGAFSYDPENKVLTMENASMEYSGANGSAILNKIDGLTINVVGDNVINTNVTGMDCIYTKYAVTLTGSGSLTSNSKFYIVSPTADPTASIILNGPTVTVSHISGWDNTDSFAILDGKLSTTYSGRPVTGIEYFTLGEGMQITTPAGGTFDATLGGITTDGSTLYTGQMVIEAATGYDLWIDGVTVTSGNANDILGDGKFRYDAANNTLYVNGTTTYSKSEPLIMSVIDGLTIDCNATISTYTEYALIQLNEDATITGKLTLYCETEDKDGVGIFANDGDLTIRDADIQILGDGFWYGITGWDHLNLIIENSELIVNAHSEGCITDWKSITLTNCYVDKPRPTKIVEKDGIVHDDGTIVGSTSETECLVIKAGKDAINGIAAPATTIKEIYDVAGRRLSAPRRGINIVRTAKGKAHKVVKK